jgi:hypothetical protein
MSTNVLDRLLATDPQYAANLAWLYGIQLPTNM